MPFLDDAGIIRENHRGPVIGALAVFGEQVERMVALSVAWSATLMPALVAAAFPGIPSWLRVGLVAVTCLTGTVGTVAMYALAGHALAGDQITAADAIAAVHSHVGSSLRTLAPLFSAVFLVASAALLAGAYDLIAVQVGFQAGLGVLLVCGVYWAPLAVRIPDARALGVLRGSGVLAWRNPGVTLKIAAATLLLVLLGLVTVAGAVLAAPAAVALVQTHLLDEVAPDIMTGGPDE